jgi:DNA-directed RNA polymerase subunit RPC12/RpoP
MKKHVSMRLLSALLALMMTVALLPLSVLSAAADDEVVLDPFEYGEKTAFADNLPTYDSEAETVIGQGGWQIGVHENATGAFKPFAVMDEFGVISLAGQIWGSAGGGLYLENEPGKIAFSGCLPGDPYVNEIRYTAQYSGRAVLNYDQLIAKREGASAADYIGFSFSVYLNGEKIWPTDADWFTCKSEDVFTEGVATSDILSALRGGGFPLMVALEQGDVISFRTQQLNRNTWMLHANPTVTYTLIEHEHTYSAWAPYDKAQHLRTCECGKEDLAPHAWGDGTVIKPATHLTEGEMLYTCTDCGETKTAPIDKLPDHTFAGAWQLYSETQHIRTCACGEVQLADHRWNEGAITQAPTHTVEGEMLYTCADCGATKTAPIDKLPGHTFAGAWQPYSETQHVRACACGELEYASHAWDGGTVTQAPTIFSEGVLTYTCTDCDATKTAELPKASRTAGDVDGDGKVTNADALAYFRYIYDSETYPLLVPEMADVTGDGKITNADVLAVFRYIYSAEEHPFYYPMGPEEDNELPFDSILGL